VNGACALMTARRGRSSGLEMIDDNRGSVLHNAAARIRSIDRIYRNAPYTLLI
jgi:hypothetical protein